MDSVQQREDGGDQNADADLSSDHEQPNKTDVAQIDEIDLADTQLRRDGNGAKPQT
jgi:hypothetical protein